MENLSVYQDQDLDTSSSWTFGFCSYPDVAAPDRSVGERVPEVDELVVAGRQKLVLLRMSGQSPNLKLILIFSICERE